MHKIFQLPENIFIEMGLLQNLKRILTIVLVTVLFSCGGDKQTDENASKEFDEAESELKEKIEEVLYEIPPPSEIPYLLQATGADFNESLINDEAKVDQYRSTSDKSSLNLGIYATDMGYLSSYDQTQEALNYLSTSKTLADYLGITGAFDVELLKRFEDNLGSKDSLSAIINESMTKTDDYLKDDDRNKLAAMVLTGSFIEGLYISTELVRIYPHDLPEDVRNLILIPIVTVILDQEKPLGDLIKLMESIDPGEDASNLIESLKELQGSFEKLNIKEQILNNNADVVLNDETLAEITTKVGEIRKKIIE